MTEKIKKKIKFQIPHAYVILLMMIIFCTILTWILPAGQFERVIDPVLDREIVVPDSYSSVEASPVGPWRFFLAIYEGMVNSSDIIFFVVFASAYVFLLMKTGTLNAMVGTILRKLGNKDYLLIPIFMLLFGVAGSTFGMYEETYGLIPAFIVIAMTLGYDRLVGGGMVFIGVATGFAAATINPFTIGIASSIAGIPLITPKVLAFRVVAFIAFMALSIGYVMRYAKKIRKDPTKSIVYGEEVHDMKEVLTREEVMNLPFTVPQKVTLVGFLVLIVVLAISVSVYEFYLTELSALFMIWMVFTGIINKMSSREIAEAFIESSEAAIYGVLLIGLSRSIQVIMSESNIIDTAVLYLSNMVRVLPKSISAVGMLVVQNLINFFIPSGSGQAVVMMPIMAPLSDLIGVSRDVSVLAYQFGDGFSNMFWPTAVALEAGLIGVGMDKWYKFITPLFVMIFILQAILITAAVLLGI
ncbi:TIGR00366 family protein [Tissierella praeacuta]|uniref:YfcC family protein n=1 Tax=Tissierella praeacuta TaxID=43131 RepID=UPI0033426B51